MIYKGEPTNPSPPLKCPLTMTVFVYVILQTSTQIDAPDHRCHLDVPEMTVSCKRRSDSCSGLWQPQRHLSVVDADDVANIGLVFRMQKHAKDKVIEYISSGLQSSPDNAAAFSSENTFCSTADEPQVTLSVKPAVESQKTKVRDSKLMLAWNGDRKAFRERSSSSQSDTSGVPRSYSSSSALSVAAGSLPAGSSVQQKSSSALNNQTEVVSVQSESRPVLQSADGSVKGQAGVTGQKAQASVSTVNAGIASRDAGKTDGRAVRKNCLAANGGGNTRFSARQLPRSQSGTLTEICKAKNMLNETVVMEDKQARSAVSSLPVAPSCDPAAVDAASHRGASNAVTSKLLQPRHSSSNATNSKCASSKLGTSGVAAELKSREIRRSTSRISSTSQRSSQLSKASSLTHISAQPTKSKAAASALDNSRLRIPKPSGKFLVLVHGQVTIIFVVSVGLFVCLCRVSLSRL